MQKLCKCGRENRPKAANCKFCNREAVRRHHQRRKDRIAKLEQIIANLTFDNYSTRHLFDSKFDNRWVCVIPRSEDPFPATTGYVVGFLPDAQLRVMDLGGEKYDVPLDRLRPDKTVRDKSDITIFGELTAERNQLAYLALPIRSAKRPLPK